MTYEDMFRIRSHVTVQLGSNWATLKREPLGMAARSPHISQ